MKVHLFKKHPHGGWSFENTQTVPAESNIKKLHHEVSGLEVGDIVKVAHAWMVYDGSGQWRSVHPNTPGYGQLTHLKPERNSR